MEQGAQARGRVCGEGGVGGLGPRGAALEGIHPPCVEGMQGIQHGLVVAAEVLGDLRGALAASAFEEDLAATQDEGIGRAQARCQRLLLGVRERTHENGCSHA
jgi:hypothetical protein